MKILTVLGYEHNMSYKNKLLYPMLLLTILVAGYFLTTYIAVARFFPAIIVHIIYITLSILLYLPLKMKKYTFVKISMLIAHMTQLTLAVFLWFPVETKFNLYYIMVPMFMFVAIEYDNVKERYIMVSLSIIAAFLYFISELIPLTYYMYQTSDELNRLYSSTSTLIILLPMIFILVMFSRALNNSYKELRILANTDELTKIMNRRVLYEQGKQEFELANKYHHDFTLIIFDIDHFKTINDRYGHPVGDVILQKLSELITKNTRKEDTFSRYGGEEFAILVRKVGRESGVVLAHKLMDIIRETDFYVEGQSIKVTVSMGVVQYTKDYNSFDHIMKAADNALYEAKHNGRNQIISL